MKLFILIASVTITSSIFAQMIPPTEDYSARVESIAVTGNGYDINSALQSAKYLCRVWARDNKIDGKDLVLKDVRPIGSRTTGSIFHVDAECIVSLHFSLPDGY